jgi:hypothetical protein
VGARGLVRSSEDRATYRLPSIVLVLLLLGPFAGAAPAPADAGPRTLNDPVLIARGKDYLIHALPSPRPTGGLFWGQPDPGSGLAVLHTDTSTGHMKRLTTGGQWSFIIPMGIDRIDHHCVRIAGILANRQRLYVLTWHAKAISRERTDTRPVAFDTGTYRLLVFRASDGKQLHDLKIEGGPPETAENRLLFVGGAMPKRRTPRPREETAGKGPLLLHPRGVRCFGVVFEFDGEKLIRRPGSK